MAQPAHGRVAGIVAEKTRRYEPAGLRTMQHNPAKIAGRQSPNSRRLGRVSAETHQRPHWQRDAPARQRVPQESAGLSLCLRRFIRLEIEEQGSR